ncbi:MAG: tetratricopeptide repeat protein [Bacteroidota bacterium]
MLFTSSCSTKKNTFTRRFYHNMTAHYNVWWNGNESLKDGVAELAKSNKDNYARVLPVFQTGTKQEAQKVNPQMDRAVEKSAKTVRLHSIYIKGKEHIKWIPPAYLLMGKAQFYKQDYKLAIRTFNFIISQYKTAPEKDEAMLWLARCKNQLNEFESAQSFLDQVKNKMDKGEASKSLTRDLAMDYADFYVKQENYVPAIDYLILAIEHTHKKSTKTRLKFILAQIYQKTGDLQRATDLYKSVIKRNPPYEMAFNARINLAMSYDATKGNSKDIVKKLMKMVKDQKNKEYLDQIYYALAEVALRDKDKPSAIKYLKLSVSSSSGNNYQKAISSLKLADLYFEIPEYINAQYYYDSTMMFLPKTYQNYELVKSKTEVLTDLVKNLMMVIVQDSLQAMAKMSPAERDKKIAAVIAEIVKEEQRKKEEELLLSQIPMSNISSNNRLPGGNAGEWYFYNPSTMSFGFSDFQRKWGKRKLEDNWRISNKQTVDFGDGLSDNKDKDESTKDGKGKDTLKAVSNPKDKNFYLKDVPLTAEKLSKSNDKIEEALYNAGFIYFEGLKDHKKAIESFDTLLRRFPETKNRLSSYFESYLVYKDLEDKTNMEVYKSKILTEFPESDYAKILLDPNYYKEIQAKNNESSLYYEETYKAFNNQNYNLVLTNYQTALSKYKKSKMFPKFEYLKVLSNGKIQGKDSLIAGLNQYINNFPKSDILPMAKLALAYLTKGKDLDLGGNYTITNNSTEKEKPKGKKNKKENTTKEQPIKKETKETKEIVETKKEVVEEVKKKEENNEVANTQTVTNTISKGIFKVSQDGEHFFVMLVDATKINVNALKIKISDFNRKYYSNSNLAVTSLIFDKNTHMITVSKCATGEDALLYFNTIKENDYIFSSLNLEAYNVFVISSENYLTFYQVKDIDSYISFFKDNYLKK